MSAIWAALLLQPPRLLGRITQRNLNKLRQLIKLITISKPFAYGSRWHSKGMLWRKIIWVRCITTVKAWYRVINKQWRGIKKRLIKEVLLHNSIWV